jgi:putative ABC transport system permease protein
LRDFLLVCCLQTLPQILTMIKYHLLLFLRNLVRQKLFAAINILGLTTGIVSSLLIYMYVKHELSYDQFHEKADKIYRINQTFIWGDDNDQYASSLGPGVAHAITAEIPEAKEVTRVHPPGNSLISYSAKNETRSFDQDGILAVDSNFLRVFTFPMIKGDPKTALQHANSIVMTESCAKKYFGDEDPIGKLVQGGNVTQDQNIKTFTITGIVQDPPENSYLDFDILMSMTTFPRVKSASWSWIWTMFETYVLLDEKSTQQQLQEKLARLPREYAAATLQNAMGTTYDEYLKSGKQWNLIAQPLTDIHLRSEKIFNRFPNVGSSRTVYVLVGVVSFIILLSCINFMNLSTAQYTKRAKDTSLRKVLGSSRWQLGKRFFTEAFLFCSIALVAGVGITQIFLPLVNSMSGTNFSLNLLADTNAIIVMVSLLLVMSLLSGSYPALFLSAFKPVEALKGKFKTGKEGKTLRNTLVVFQFATSLVLITSTLIVFQQLKFLAMKDIGFDRQNLMVVSRLEWVKDKTTFIDELKGIPGVQMAAWSSSVPPKLYDGDSFVPEGSQGKTISLNYVKANEDFASVLKLKFAVGRYFSQDRPSDKNGVILNETAVRDLGWKLDETTLGRKIHYPGDNLWFEVIGIVRDFNYWSLTGAIQPMAMFSIHNEIFSSNQQFAVIRVNPKNTETWNAMQAGIDQTWKKFAGDAPLQYEFVDEAFAQTFKEQEIFSKALTVFAALTIMIAALGLLGMIVFTIELKTKEIGIRKVIGATVWNILVMVTKDFSRLIFLAIIVSIPVALWLMNAWLKDFEYRVEVSPFTFVIAGSLTFFVALAITGYHAVKAALTNPVDVLKDE